MNNLKNKKIISIIRLVLVIIVFGRVVFYINSEIRKYKTVILDDYNNLAKLEDEISTFNIYNKILSKDSDESVKIKKYILSNDKKEVLDLVNQFEEYIKAVRINENGTSPILSVQNRDNETIKKYNANELVINIKINGSEYQLDKFIELLDNLPMVSYIEKINMKLDSINNKNSANITLVVYQKNEVN